MTPASGQLIGGKYLLARPLAHGGMGELWVGHHVELDIAVAIKFLEAKLASEPEFVRRFQREARAAARLRSAHVTRIHDYGVDQGAPYIAMELLEGETLADCMAREGHLTVARVAGIVAQLGKGLAEAHQAGIVHRDLKPSNVFLARVAGEEVVKILDFGIAKELFGRREDTAVTDSGVLLGSPRYMSPEQARGSAIDHRTDLWSLGVLVFEAVTGEPLFDSNHQGNLIAAITGDPLPCATELRPELPAAIDGFFERALARNPEARFKRVATLAEELAAIAEGREPRREELAATQEMQDFHRDIERPRGASTPPPAGTPTVRDSLPPPGRSSPTLPLSHAAQPARVDEGVASTIRRRAPAPWRWYALGAALVVAALSIGLWRAPAPAVPAALAGAGVEGLALAPAARPAPRATASAAPRPSARPAPRPAQARTPKPRTSAVDPNFGLPVSGDR